MRVSTEGMIERLIELKVMRMAIDREEADLTEKLSKIKGSSTLFDRRRSKRFKRLKSISMKKIWASMTLEQRADRLAKLQAARALSPAGNKSAK